jgi:hypothetical protein
MEKIRGDKRTVKAEKRISERHPHQGAITFSIFNRQKCSDAQSLDCSTNGLRFKSACVLQPGTTICIRAKSGQNSSRSGRFSKSIPSLGLAEVKWCRQLDGSESPFYEVGVRYYPPDY